MIAYILPFAAYIVITMIANLFPHGNLYGYPIKTLIVSCILIYFRNTYSELFTGISNRSITRSIILGSIVFIIWILPEGLYPYLGYSEFDPTEVS
ncbi:hypothetical protein GF337_14210, partial [candidate division KSB1 bacterium]|nr:hypothetical protein [candidate division KSB1 bacterium]